MSDNVDHAVGCQRGPDIFGNGELPELHFSRGAKQRTMHRDMDFPLYLIQKTCEAELGSACISNFPKILDGEQGHRGRGVHTIEHGKRQALLEVLLVALLQERLRVVKVPLHRVITIFKVEIWHIELRLLSQPGQSSEYKPSHQAERQGR